MLGKQQLYRELYCRHCHGNFLKGLKQYLMGIEYVAVCIRHDKYNEQYG